MLVHHSYYCGGQAALALLTSIRKLIPAYHEYRVYERLNSWMIPSNPDLVLMEGRQVKPHDDGGKFWQPFIVLHNPSNSYSFRGPRQPVRSLTPHTDGSLLVLDIGKQHQATGRSREIWSVLCWNPSCCVPRHDDYDLQSVIDASREAFDQLRKEVSGTSSP